MHFLQDIKNYLGYFELKLHIQTLGTSETYFTSCKRVHNRPPLKDKFGILHLKPCFKIVSDEIERLRFYHPHLHNGCIGALE